MIALWETAEERTNRRLANKWCYIQVIEYYAVMKKKEAALHVLMREDHQDRLLGEKDKSNGDLPRVGIGVHYRFHLSSQAKQIIVK